MFVDTAGVCVGVHSKASANVHFIWAENWINCNVLSSNIHTEYQPYGFENIDMDAILCLSVNFHHAEK